MPSRPPQHPALQALLECVWVSEPAPAGRSADAMPACERVLPTGHMHLVFRLGGPLLRMQRHDDGQWHTLSSAALVGGARSASYVRDVSQLARSVGAQLRPGAAALLLRANASALAQTHVPLQSFWGRHADDALARLRACANPAACLDLFEALLVQRLMPPITHASDAARRMALQAAAQLAQGRRVADVARQSGYSARHFNARFEEFCGLRPKQYSRVARLQRLLGLAQPADAGLAWAQLADAADYADQAHMARDFRDLTQLTPTQWQAAAGPALNHVPLAAGIAPRRVDFVQDRGLERA